MPRQASDGKDPSRPEEDGRRFRLWIRDSQPCSLAVYRAATRPAPAARFSPSAAAQQWRSNPSVVPVARGNRCLAGGRTADSSDLQRCNKRPWLVKPPGVFQSEIAVPGQLTVPIRQ